MKSATSPSLPATLSHQRLFTSDSGDDFAITIDPWMQESGLDSNFLYAIDWPQHKASLDSNSDASSFYEPHQNTSLPIPEWHFSTGSPYLSASQYQPGAVPRRSLQQSGHRRALSNSTSDSYASSPASYPVALPQSAGFDYSTPLFDNGYGGYHPQSTPVQYQPHLSTRVPIRGRQATSADATKPEQNIHQFQAQQQQQQQQQTMSSYQQNPQMGQQNASRPFPKIETGQPYAMAYPDNPYTGGITSAPSQMSATSQASAYNNSPYSARPVNTLSSRLQEANATRSSASPTQRQASPFRTQSPYANQGDAYGPPPQMQQNVQRQQHKGERFVYDQHHPQSDGTQPKTISPKDAVLDEFRTPGEEDANATALFPQGSAAEQLAGRMYPTNGGLMQPTAFGYPLGTLQSGGQQQMAKDFNYNPLASLQSASTGSQGTNPDYPAHLIAMETSKSEQDDDVDGSTPRPANMAADGGTYSCTYHGCTERFNTAAQLQKHKREAHRPPPNSQMQSPGGQTPAQMRNSQAGPHRCDRINPSTGKPCNTVFSRPYDLTRHEDTIHAQRMKVRCQYCQEEKTFSRNDALTRHMRVVHPTIEFPGKHKKRHTE